MKKLIKKLKWIRVILSLVWFLIVGMVIATFTGDDPKPAKK